MKICVPLLLIIGIVLPMSASTQSVQAMTRRDGFLQIWQGIERPAQPAKTRFTDLPETERGSLEIDYAASRGLIDDDEALFHPDEPLRLTDALVWLLRTRNVDDPDRITDGTLSGYLLRYPIVHLSDDAKNIAPEELTQIMHLLDEELKTEEHEISLYAEKFHGKGTAFGETFDMNAMTAAHRTFPHNTLVNVTNVENGKSVIVRINDRGPFVEGRDMDLSLAAFTAIADRSKGVIQATFERLGDATLAGVCSGGAMQRRIGGGAALKDGVPQFFSLGQSLALRSDRPFVVRGVLYPDGNSLTVQDFVFPGETFTFSPAIEGEYAFIVGGIRGRKRMMKMKVIKCSS